MEIQSPIRLEDIPELKEAVERETFYRQFAFSGLTERIGDLECCQLTPRLHLILLLAKSPLILGGEITPLVLANFLWIISPRYNAASKFWRRVSFARCSHFFPPRLPMFKTKRAISKYKNAYDKSVIAFHEMVNAITEYMEDTFQDAPAGSGDGPRKSYFSESAAMISVFAKEFGWSAEQIMTTPLAQLFQLLKTIEQRHALEHGQKPMLANRRSESVSAKFILNFNRN